jgi:hypothetical protein
MVKSARSFTEYVGATYIWLSVDGAVATSSSSQPGGKLDLGDGATMAFTPGNSTVLRVFFPMG